MLSQKTLTSIAGILKVDPAALKAAIEDKAEVGIKVKVKEGETEVEKDYDPAGLQTFTAEELTTRDANVQEAAKTTYITAGKEIAIKELKTKLEIDIPGKDPDKFIEAAKAKFLKEAKVAPDQKVQELEAQLALLKQNIAATEAEKSTLAQQVQEAKLDSRILASLPEDRNKNISDADYLLMIKNRIKVETIENKEVVKNVSTGEVIRDNKTATSVDVKTAIGGLFTENTGWSGSTDKGDGRGGGSSKPKVTGGEPTTYSEAAEAWRKSGKSLNSAEFSVYVGKLQTDNKDFKMDIETVQPETGGDE